ncbi:MAG: permease, partial [Acidimicrobiales bacterium]
LAPSPPALAPSPPAPSTDRDGPQGPMAADRRFAAALVRLSVTLVPEYLAVVLLLGAFRGWLFPVAHGLASWGVAAVVVFALAGTLFVIPTAGEIPIIQGLLAAGVAAGPVGALVVTLPALSLPSMVMVSRSFPKRVVVAMAGAVAVLGLVAAALVVTLTGS